MINGNSWPQIQITFISLRMRVGFYFNRSLLIYAPFWRDIFTFSLLLVKERRERVKRSRLKCLGLDVPTWGMPSLLQCVP